MAEGDIVFYNAAKKKILDNDIDFAADTIKVTLHTGYTPNIDTDEFWDDISSTEYSTDAGYTAGGVTLGSKTVTTDTANDQADVDAADPSWSSLGPLTPNTPSHAVMWKDTGTPATSPLLLYVVLGTTPTNGSNYALALNAGGLFTLT
jgi:hypothetical protein